MRTEEKKQVDTDLYTFENEAEASQKLTVRKRTGGNIDSYQHRTIQGG